MGPKKRPEPDQTGPIRTGPAVAVAPSIKNKNWLQLRFFRGLLTVATGPKTRDIFPRFLPQHRVYFHCFWRFIHDFMLRVRLSTKYSNFFNQY